MSKPSFSYEPKGTNFRPASPGTLLVFLAARFVGRVARNISVAFREGLRSGRKAV
jgi:hypothetical protein